MNIDTKEIVELMVLGAVVFVLIGLALIFLMLLSAVAYQGFGIVGPILVFAVPAAGAITGFIMSRII